VEEVFGSWVCWRKSGKFVGNYSTMIADIITISPDVQSGTPVFANTRVPVKNLFDYLRGGDTIEEFLHDFPSVKREQVSGLLEIVESLITLTPHEKKAAA
jgi:uncharacterized protein (DUF433 family)